jgi:hypothetical protein
MASASVASSVDVLSSVERSMVVEGLTLRIAQLKRALNVERDSSIVEIRNRQIATYESLVTKFR